MKSALKVVPPILLSIRGRYWCYDSRCWTFSRIFHYVLLPCNRWQHRGSLTKWYLMWKCVWSRGVSLDSSMWKKCQPLMILNTFWVLMETKQCMWAHWGNGWCISVVATGMWKESHIPDGRRQLSHHEMKSVSLHSSPQTNRSQPVNCAWSWVSTSVHWKQLWQCWNITKSAPRGSHECS